MRHERHLKGNRHLCVLLGTMCVGAPASAQEVYGTLRAGASSAPAAGVVIIAKRIGDGTSIGSTVTGERGTFRLTVTTDSLQVLALRIGQRPVTLGVVRAAIGEQRDLSMSLLDDPVSLSPVRAKEDNRCKSHDTGGAIVGELFTAARTALLASSLVSVDGQPRSHYRLVIHHWNNRDERVDSLQQTLAEVSDSLRPFRSVPVDSLVNGGYVVSQSDGTTLYRAPDADVVTDDRFLARYCLQLAADTAEHPDWIGVRFRPISARRGVSDVSGTLWLERKTHALKRLDFQYIGLDAVTMKANPGGWMAFARLPNGIWFVSAWELRMPKVARRVDVAPRSRVDPQPVITEQRSYIGMQVLTGDVQAIELAGRLMYAAKVVDEPELPSAHPLVVEERDEPPVVPMADPRSPVADRAASMVGGGAVIVVVDSHLAPVPYALVSVANGSPRAADSLGRVRLGTNDELEVPARVQRIGFTPFSGVLTRESATEPFVVQLASLHPTLATVRTVAPRNTMLSRTGFYDRMDRVRNGAMVGDFLTPEELELRLHGPVSAALQGSRYVRVRGGALLGRGDCRMQILLDGRRVEGSNPDKHVSANEVMAIEVYPSTANAPGELIPLTAQGSCGIVAIWTGPRQ